MSRLRSPVFCILSVVLLLGSLNTCRRSSSRAGPNVLLITLDTLRADYVSAYGSDAAATPAIDSFAKKGVVFENAYSPTPITAPAHASLFYSLPPHRLRLYNNGQVFEPDTELSSLAGIFQKQGYTTAAFISLGVLQAKFKLNAGFDIYSDQQHPQRWYLTAAEINDRALKWIRENKGRDFFLWLHYSDPHDPYAPPTLPSDLDIFLNSRMHAQLCLQRREDLTLRFPLQKGENRIFFQATNPFPSPRDEYRVSLNDFAVQVPEEISWELHKGEMLNRGDKQILAFRETAEILVRSPLEHTEAVITAKGNLNLFPSEQTEGYRREVEYLDTQLGKLTQMLQMEELLEKTIIILAGDHGEGLGEYLTGRGEAYYGHIHYLQQVYLKVPLIFSYPDLFPEPRRRAEPVCLMDIAPTLLSLMDWEIPEFYSGRDLFTAKEVTHLPLLRETYTPESSHDRFSLLSPPWHLIFTPSERTFELYDLINDPREKVNVYSKHSRDEHIMALTREIIDRAREILKSKTDITLDEDSKEMLRSLGYIK